MYIAHITLTFCHFISVSLMLYVVPSKMLTMEQKLENPTAHPFDTNSTAILLLTIQLFLGGATVRNDYRCNPPEVAVS